MTVDMTVQRQVVFRRQGFLLPEGVHRKAIGRIWASVLNALPSNQKRDFYPRTLISTILFLAFPTPNFVFLQNPRPLYSFEDNGDYVYDVQWSPIHPALFAAVDGTGRLDLWNLNNDTEVNLDFKSLLDVDVAYRLKCLIGILIHTTKEVFNTKLLELQLFTCHTRNNNNNFIDVLGKIAQGEILFLLGTPKT